MAVPNQATRVPRTSDLMNIPEPPGYLIVTLPSSSVLRTSTGSLQTASCRWLWEAEEGSAVRFLRIHPGQADGRLGKASLASSPSGDFN